ncbi:unnamed protein product [Danaus chrysippus]|uniref:(African queen) hypothetical protein n=1 Tax=Danaus chrysippus TaxID=151541 RepID=A0A8J2QQK6_9NEOP|nr:unnamed protein product [Danaus chrysippus]
MATRILNCRFDRPPGDRMCGLPLNCIITYLSSSDLPPPTSPSALQDGRWSTATKRRNYCTSYLNHLYAGRVIPPLVITQIRFAEHLANRVSLIYKAVKPQLYRPCVKLSAVDVKRISS